MENLLESSERTLAIFGSVAAGLSGRLALVLFDIRQMTEHRSKLIKDGEQMLVGRTQSSSSSSSSASSSARPYLHQHQQSHRHLQSPSSKSKYASSHELTTVGKPSQKPSKKAVSKSRNDYEDQLASLRLLDKKLADSFSEAMSLNDLHKAMSSSISTNSSYSVTKHKNNNNTGSSSKLRASCDRLSKPSIFQVLLGKSSSSGLNSNSTTLARQVLSDSQAPFGGDSIKKCDKTTLKDSLEPSDTITTPMKMKRGKHQQYLHSTADDDNNYSDCDDNCDDGGGSRRLVCNDDDNDVDCVDVKDSNTAAIAQSERLKQIIDDIGMQTRLAMQYSKQLEAQLARIESLRSKYEMHLKMAKYHYKYNPLSATTGVKSTMKDFVQNILRIEAQLESMMGSFALAVEDIQGFARVCPGDVFEIKIKYGEEQKFKTKIKILTDSQQKCDNKQTVLKARIASMLALKAYECKGSLGKRVLLGHKLCETRDLFAPSSQLMTISLNQTGSIKLNLIVTWNPTTNIGGLATTRSSSSMPDDSGLSSTHSSASILPMLAMRHQSSPQLPTLSSVTLGSLPSSVQSSTNASTSTPPPPPITLGPQQHQSRHSPTVTTRPSPPTTAEPYYFHHQQLSASSQYLGGSSQRPSAAICRKRGEFFVPPPDYNEADCSECCACNKPRDAHHHQQLSAPTKITPTGNYQKNSTNRPSKSIDQVIDEYFDQAVGEYDDDGWSYVPNIRNKTVQNQPTDQDLVYH